VTWIILLWALLAVFAGIRPGLCAPKPLLPETADGALPAALPEERHDTDDGLTSQPSLSRPGVRTGKARPAMIRRAQTNASPWQGDRRVLPSSRPSKGPMATDARTPSAAIVARAHTRAP